MTRLEIALLEALKTAKQALEEVGAVSGHGETYTAREIMPNVFCVIDNALALVKPVDCWFCDGTKEYQGQPCLICVEQKP
jgi:hypothetical protein